MEAIAGPTESSALPVHLISRVIDHLDPNLKVFAGRLVSRDAWKRLGQLSHYTARFSLPLPAQIRDPAWQPHLQQALQQLTFRQKLGILAAAASSGSEFNLEVAWGLLRPGLFPELLSPPQAPGIYGCSNRNDDAGSASLRSGSSHLLPWLLQHRCPLDSQRMFVAAAEHCDLAGLQRVSELLGGISYPTDSSQWALWCKLTTAAGRSGVASVAKLSWLLSVAGEGPQEGEEEGHRQRLLTAAAAGAAASGDMDVLHWLQQQGMDLRTEHDESYLWLAGAAPWWVVLAAALQQGHVAVADWLVDEAGCPLPQAGEQEQLRAHMEVWRGVALGGSVDAMRWLLRRGVPVEERAVQYAAGAGRLEAVQFLHGECGLELTATAFANAAGSGSMPTVSWLLHAGCPMDPAAYVGAAQAGDAGMMRWLAQEAGCPVGKDKPLACMCVWPRDRACNGDSEQALRVLVEAGGLLPSPSPPLCLDTAAARGDLPLLRYLHEELGIRFGPGTLGLAAWGGSEALLEWMVGKGCVAGEGQGASDPYAVAGQRGDLATLSCLRRLGVPWGAGPYWGPARGDRALQGRVPLPVLRWMVEQGASWDQEAVREGVRRAKEAGQFGDTVTWFEAQLADGAPAAGLHACKA